MKSSTLLRALWLAAGLSLLLGLGRDTLLGLMPRARELPRFDGATGRSWIASDFVRGDLHGNIEAGILPAGLPTVSSWPGTDDWQGTAETAWFKASRRLTHVGVAGYPQHRGCRLWAEFRDAAGTVTRVDCPLGNPREQWGIWEIVRPSDAVAVRLVAEDRASDHTGWLAFSHPFRAWPGALTASYQHAQIWTTLALALLLIWGPALALIARRTGVSTPLPNDTSRPACSIPLLIGAGPLLLASFGVVIWVLSPWVRPPVSAQVLVALSWLAIGACLHRRGFSWPESAALGRVFGIMGLVTVAVVAKSFHSVGPEGELFRGTVSRNFEMADRIDSRYSFYSVQAAAHARSPNAPETERFYSPWTFFSRGPLAGLASIPVVLATGGQPSNVVPENRWQPFDATGFAAYRVLMIALAGTVLVALFLMLVPLVGEKWAGIATGLVALAPFGVHEILFTWPKWAATAWLIACFGLAHARRPAAAGLALGVGFLFHPLVLLWAPWIALWSAGRGERRAAPFVLALARFGAGAAVLVIPWMALGTFMPHLPTTPLAGQSGFFRYFTRADWQPATWSTWWHTRWMNFANTFVPLHGYLADASFNHPKLGSAYEPSSRVVKFSQLWWNSLPFALGIGLWGLSLAALARATRTLAAVVILFVAAPALFCVAYWGMDPLGLMRECGHPLFIAIVVITVILAARQRSWLRTALAHPAVPWLQLPETWLMLWLTALLNPRPWAADYTQLDAFSLVLSTAALLGAAWMLIRSRRVWADAPDSATSETLTPPARATTGGLRALAANPPAWLILTLGALTLALRRPDQIHTPQFWAEDGVFFSQAYNVGFQAFGVELAGYLHLAPRVIAALSLLFDPAWAPHVFVGATLALTLYVMSQVLSPRCPLPLRPWAALCIVLVPDASEVVLNALNIQWILACGGVLLLISREPTRRPEWIHDVLSAVFIGLTGPFCVLLTPFFAARAFFRRTRASLVLAAIVASCAVAQAVSIVLHPQPPPANGIFDGAAMAAFPGLRIAGVLVFGAWQPATLPWAVGLILTLTLGGMIAFLMLRASETRPLRIALGLAFLAMLASTLYRCWHSMPALCLPGGASRYIFPLQLLLLWLLLAMLRDRARWVRVTCAAAAIWMIVVNLPRMQIGALPDKRWADYAPKLRAGEEVSIPINPDGWSFTFSAKKR